MKDPQLRLVIVCLAGLLTAVGYTEEITLGYKPREIPLKYRVSQDVRVRAHGERERRGHTDAVLREERVRISPDGLLSSDVSVRYLDKDGKLIARPTEETGTIATISRRTKTGRPVPGDREKSDAPLIWSLLSAPGALPVLPCGQVAVGDTWSTKVSVHSWFNTFDVEVSCKLQSLEEHSGYNCAKISYTFYGQWDLREESDNPMEAVNRMVFQTEEIAGTGTVFFAYDIGAVVAQEQVMNHTFDSHVGQASILAPFSTHP